MQLGCSRAASPTYGKGALLGSPLTRLWLKQSQNKAKHKGTAAAPRVPSRLHSCKQHLKVVLLACRWTKPNNHFQGDTCSLAAAELLDQPIEKCTAGLTTHTPLVEAVANQSQTQMNSSGTQSPKSTAQLQAALPSGPVGLLRTRQRQPSHFNVTHAAWLQQSCFTNLWERCTARLTTHTPLIEATTKQSQTHRNSSGTWSINSTAQLQAAPPSDPLGLPMDRSEGHLKVTHATAAEVLHQRMKMVHSWAHHSHVCY
jgi:hypothetical protein